MKIYELNRDISGVRYERLLHALLDCTEGFGLIWRDQLRFSADAMAIRKRLAHLELKRFRSSRWPGTVMTAGDQASGIMYEADPSAFSVLAEPGSLYAWLAPAHPEDLWFFDRRLQPLLVTVTHEGDGWVLSRRLASRIGQITTLRRGECSKRDRDILEGVTMRK